MAEHIPPKTFPFPTVLSLKLLTEYWESEIRSGKIPFGQSLLNDIKRVPELKRLISDTSVLSRHKKLIDFLLSAAIPPAQTDKQLTAATVPFTFDSFYQTNSLNGSVELASFDPAALPDIPRAEIIVRKTIYACLLILQRYYKVDVIFDKPVLISIKDRLTGLDKVYELRFSHEFLEIVNKGDLPPIHPAVIRFLTEKVSDVDPWLQYIRPDNFEFRGFMILRIRDVTQEEMVSSIKYDLLEKNALSQKQTFTTIQGKLRSILDMPEIHLGMAFMDANDKMVLSPGQANDCWKSVSDEQDPDCKCRDYVGSIYERSWVEQRSITIQDLPSYPFKGVVEQSLMENGIKSILLAPLIYDGETIGILELASPTAAQLTSFSARKIDGILPVFAAAVKRAKDESITEVRAIIQEECTNIHPVVQWRFLEAGQKVLEKRRRGESAVFEEIVFKEIYPLFGMADVRNSSLERTRAIQKDLSRNIRMVSYLLKKIQASRDLPILDETLFKTEALLQKVNSGLASGDESSTLDFLKQEIHPFLSLFEEDSEFNEDIAEYKKALDPAFGIVYQQRRDFETSLHMINNMISSYLAEAQTTAQEMFPHYFEKYQTDGIEYTMYLGSSLTRGRKFNRFFLKNFRLWQLLTSCEIEKRMQQLRPALKNRLDIAQLILVHDQPLSIRFKPDEKQFDVDGAYDIRYEIIKKRIDKATVRKTGERLTQPGKVAIIYNDQQIRDEYKRYIDYLSSRHIISGPVEELELEELPGANGLRALRIQLTPSAKVPVPSPRDLMTGMELQLQ